MTQTIFLIYMSLLVFTFTVGLFRLSIFSDADKLICLLLLMTIINEGACNYLGRAYNNDMIAWHIYSPIELLLICFYFNASVPVLKRGHIGLLLGLIGLLFSIVNSLCFQPPDTIPSNFLLFEALSVVSLSMTAFYHMAGTASGRIWHTGSFWIKAAFLFYYMFSAMQWGMYHWLEIDIYAYGPVIWLLWTFNLLFYSIIAVVFVFYRKLNPPNATA